MRDAQINVTLALLVEKLLSTGAAEGEGKVGGFAFQEDVMGASWKSQGRCFPSIRMSRRDPEEVIFELSPGSSGGPGDRSRSRRGEKN